MDFPLKPLITLLAIVNPIGVIPFFIHFTRNFSPAQRARTVRVAAFTAFVVIAISALAGLKVLEFFGISLASFQVGGGMLLLISSMHMLNAQPAESSARTSTRAPAAPTRAPASPSCRWPFRCSPDRQRSRPS
jgi:multiple antibiotic resistance protein